MFHSHAINSKSTRVKHVREQKKQRTYISKHQPVLHFLFPSIPNYSMSIIIADSRKC